MTNIKPVMQPASRLYWLDWVRFLAAFVVVLAHARAETWVSWGELLQGERTFAGLIIFTLSRFGHEAVVIFFVLSGFFVGGKVVDLVMFRRHEALRGFIIDRLVRIYLPLVPCLVLTLAVGKIVRDDIQLAEVVGSLLGVQGVFTKVPAANVSLWSLSYEVWFYALGGSLLAILSPLHWIRVLGWFVFAASVGVYVKLNPMYLLCWALGALGWILMRSSIKTICVWILIAATLIGFALNIWADLAQHSKESAVRLGALAFMSAGIAPLLGLIGKARPSGICCVLEESGSRLASFSYTLYLAHYPLFMFMNLWLPAPSATISISSIAAFGIRIFVAVAASYLLYLLFERHTAAAKSYLKQACS